MTEALHTAYRPHEFTDVVGQAATIKSLQMILAKGTSQCFLFSGPTGVGKTTLARIVARKAGCKLHNTQEFDASTNTGVDDVRELQKSLRYPPFDGGAKAFIIDEAHGLSKQAWNALLKVTEEPPEWVYFFLCTTELGKVPATIKTRFSKFKLNPVSEREISELVELVAKEEGIKLDETVLDVIVAEAGGSPREALNHLASVGHMTNKKEAAAALASAHASDATLELCRFLVQGSGSWTAAMKIVDKLKEEAPESVRIVVSNYIAAALRGAKSDDKAADLLRRLDAFSFTYTQGEQKPQLLMSIGRVLFSD